MRPLIIATVLALTSCVSVSNSTPARPHESASATAAAAASQPCHPADATINATLWMQTSGEYEAITREVFAMAAQNLDAAVHDETWVAQTETVPSAPSKPPAIVLDIDETVLDTSANQGRLIHTGTAFTEAGWHDYAMHDASLPIQAALDFVNAASAKGVAVFFITNRLASEEAPLRATLGRLGFPLATAYDNVLTRGERPEWNSGDKSARRAFVGATYRIVMMFGDDLNDFVPAAGRTLEERRGLVSQYAQWWGRRWFALPNPVYGSWERAALGPTPGMSDCDQMQKKIQTVR